MMSEYPKHPCRLCNGFVQAGEDDSNWGLDWYKGYVHFSCIENIFDATRRMQNKPEYASLTEKVEIEHEQVCQFIRDMYTGRFAEREEYYWELPQWIRDAIEVDPIYKTAEEQDDDLENG